MKIAQVITLYRPDFVGGATLVCERVARGLAARGHDVTIFCGRPDPDLPAYDTTTWHVDDIPVTGAHVAAGYAQLAVASYHHPEVVPAFERMLETAAPDVVHVHSIQALGAELLQAASARNIPVVLTMHDWWWYCARLFLVDPGGFVCPPRVDPSRCHCAPEVDFAARRVFLDTMLAHARVVLTPSQTLADAVVANGTSRARVLVCRNGVDALPAPAPRAGAIRFGYIGGADHRLKGLPTLLEAAMELDVGGWELALYGVAQAVVPPVVADRIRLRPSFPPERLADVLGEVDCVIVPSLMRESFSLVVREALAAGCPVITSDSGGPEEVVRHGENGLIFATARAHDLATALRRFVMEPDLRETVRAGARSTAVPKVAAQLDQLEAIYAQACARETSARRPTAHARGAAQHVSFICGMDGAPLRYRVTNLRDQLALHGVSSEALYWTSADVPAAIERSTAVVLYRTPMSPWIEACIAYARALGRPLVFSCDDLIFDRAEAPTEALTRLPEAHRHAWLDLCDRYAETLRACDRFLGSTPTLVEAARRLGVDGDVVANGLGIAQLDVAERAYKRAAARPRSPRTAGPCIAYLSGTNMHDLDFALIEPALATVLDAHPTARLRLVGYLRPTERLAGAADRVERLPFLPWPALLDALTDVDVNLAPIAPAGAFGDAKSAVKYIEAAVMGVPTIASPTPPFRAAVTPGANGLLAASGEWERALAALVADGPLRRRLGNAARTDAFLHYGPAAQADALLDTLDRWTARAAPPRGAAVAAPTPPTATRYDLEPATLLPGAAEPGRDAPSPFLNDGRAVGQRFRASGDGLQRIDLAVGTDDRPHAHTLRVHLTSQPGTDAPDLRTVDIDTATIANHAWIAAEFAPLEDSADRIFYVWAEAIGAHPDDAVTLWTYVTGWGETPPTGLHLDHEPAPGSLSFRTFYATPRDG